MNFIVEKEVLLTQLNKANPFTESKATFPVLTKFHIECSGEGLIIKATDLSISFNTKVPVLQYEGEKKSFLIEAKRLVPIIQSFPFTNLLFDFISEGQIKIKSVDKTIKASFILPILNPNDFPELPVIDNKDSIILNQQLLKTFLKSVFYAGENQNTNTSNLNGIYFDFNSFYSFVATDTRRFAFIRDFITYNETKKLKVVIPMKMLKELNKNLSDNENEKVTVYWNNNLIVFEMGNDIYQSTFFEGAFPAYEKILNLECVYHLDLNLQELKTKIERVSLVSNETNNGVILRVKDNCIKIEMVTAEVGESYEEIIIESNVGDFEIAFNYQFLLDVLKVFQDKGVTNIYIGIKDKNSPFVIKGNRAFEHEVHIIAPLKI